jgi:hypothetical protein
MKKEIEKKSLLGAHYTGDQQAKCDYCIIEEDRKCSNLS